jgi:formate hydrogenlyase transcriptional activator
MGIHRGALQDRHSQSLALRARQREDKARRGRMSGELMNLIDSPVERPPADHEGARERALVDVASLVDSHTGLAELLAGLRAKLEPLVPFAYLAMGLRDSDGETLSLKFISMRPGVVEEVPAKRCPLDASYTGLVVQTGEPVYVPRVERGGLPPCDILAEHGIRSFCGVPLKTPRQTFGTLHFGSATADAYSPEDIEFMSRVGRLVAVAVENATILETVRRQQAVLQRERDHLDLLLEVTNAVVTQLDIRELFAAVAPALRRCCSADLAALTLFDETTGALRKYACDVPPEFCPAGEPPPAIDLSLDESPSGVVFTTKVPRVFSHADLESFAETRPLLERGVRSACSVPLITPQGVLGTLDLAAFAPGAFNEDQLGLLTRVAGQIAIAVSNAFSYRRIEALNAQLAQEKLYFQDEIRSEHRFEEIIGRSTALRRVLKEIETVAPTDSTVLILGETGSGKELVARAIHELGPRKDQAFVKLNCAAIPTGLLESELFGHERGAFTGAISQRIGRFELASRGTVFLDEIGEIPLELQPKLLRVLQEREFERLGSARTLRTDARLIAATNRDLAALADEQKFRPDLYYRLNVFPIHVPPLRERREDVPMLVRHFAQQFARRMKKPIDTIPAETMDALVRYEWPGNIRELQNLIERAVILSSGAVLDVPLAALNGRKSPPVHPESPEARPEPQDTLEQAERRHIVQALEATKWVVGGPNGAAARLGMKRSTLQFRMRKLSIARP